MDPLIGGDDGSDDIRSNGQSLDNPPAVHTQDSGHEAPRGDENKFQSAISVWRSESPIGFETFSADGQI